jgi:hypothetical protein
MPQVSSLPVCLWTLEFWIGSLGRRRLLLGRSGTAIRLSVRSWAVPVARFLLGLKEAEEERRKIFDFCLALLSFFFLMDFLMAGIVRFNFVG